jgi:hypothetical protein
MAKALIAAAHGKGPDRSYIGGCSNGGRRTFVAMTRTPAEYDAYLAGAPGYRLPDWVEKGQPPDSVTAYARGAGNAVGVNRDLPVDWSAHRARPLCPYPKVARLRAGATDLEAADSFGCE